MEPYKRFSLFLENQGGSISSTRMWVAVSFLCPSLQPLSFQWLLSKGVVAIKVHFADKSAICHGFAWEANGRTGTSAE